MIATWVIGGTSGIGFCTADLLRENPNRSVWATGADSYDVRDKELLGSAWVEFERHYLGRMIEVVYCAGINRLAAIGNLSEDVVKSVFDVNVLGFISLIDAMRRSGAEGVRMVVVSSDAAVRPMRTSIAYCSSKAALNMAIRCAARELAHVGWRVNGIAPGMTSGTEMTNYIDRTVPAIRGWSEEEARKYELEQAVIKRRATPREIAETIKMVLEAPDYLNGEIITANGGR